MLSRLASNVRPHAAHGLRRGLQRGFQRRNLSSSFNTSSTPNLADMMGEFKPPPMRWLAAAGVGAVGIYTAKNSVLMADAGIVYVMQNQLSGTLTVITVRHSPS